MAAKSFIFKFADVEVREREFSLVKAGQAQPVEPKAFRVLLILLRNPQMLIPKEELLNAVWGDAAVTENSLTRAVALLRRLLDDDARNPRFIETVTTVGYRWLSAVEQRDGPASASSAPEPTSSAAAPELAPTPAPTAESASRTISRRWVWWLSVGAAAVVLLAGGIWYLSRPLPPPRITAYTQITHDGRKKYLGGTDGSRIYFTYTSPNTIGQVAVSGGEIANVPVAVPATAMEVNDVSPDGSSLMMRSPRPGTDDFNIWSDRVLGGSLKRLGSGQVGSFSPDGKFVVYTTNDGDLQLVGRDGAGTRTLASPGKKGGWPVSADLRYLLAAMVHTADHRRGAVPLLLK